MRQDVTFSSEGADLRGWLYVPDSKLRMGSTLWGPTSRQNKARSAPNRRLALPIRRDPARPAIYQTVSPSLTLGVRKGVH
jgi:hypothetical protein